MVNGVTQGCLYVLLASGLTLVFGILNVPNFAQGSLYMLSAVTAFYLVISFSLNYWLALVLAVIMMGILGLAVYWLLFHPMRNAPMANLFVIALALSMIIEGGSLYWFGAEPKWLILPASKRILTFGGVTLTLQRLIILIATVVVMIALYVFIKKTALGAALEATAQNRQGAMLCGIKIYWVSAWAFILGTALAGVAGVMIAPVVQVVPAMGLSPLLVAFSAIILGGMGSIPGAIIGAMVLAIIESLASGYVSAAYSLVFVFMTMIIILIVRPKGLLGKE